jgi:hypothetical protein
VPVLRGEVVFEVCAEVWWVGSAACLYSRAEIGREETGVGGVDKGEGFSDLSWGGLREGCAAGGGLQSDELSVWG